MVDEKQKERENEATSTRLIEKYRLSELTHCRNHRIQMDSFRSRARLALSLCVNNPRGTILSFRDT